MNGAKRKRSDDDDPDASTPRKALARELHTDESEDDVITVHTPSKTGRNLLVAENGTPRSILKKSGLSNVINGTPSKSNRKLVFETPTKSARDDTPNGTPTIVRNADRSARRKSNRKMLERTINGDDSEEEVMEEEDSLAQQILSDEEDQGQPDAEEALPEPPVEIPEVIPEVMPEPETPVKRGRGRPRKAVPKAAPTGTGRPRGRPRKPRSPTPPEPGRLPAHEEYFWENRPGGTKTSNNTLPSQSLLNHDEYFQAMQAYADQHQDEMDFLLELHSRAFDQWIFELNEGFNICLYGYGSKRSITERFTAHLYEHLLGRAPYKGTRKVPKIVVINGYASGTNIKEILTTIASTIAPPSARLPNQPPALLSFLLDLLTTNPPPHPIPVILNTIDSLNLRKFGIPTLLATLAAHPSINLLCTADTPNFSLLWDVGLKSQYKFLFHDATTFAPYTAEIDVVESVNELLGRSGRRVGGRDGVGFVLRSLPENARSLFRILVAEQLSLMMMEDVAMNEDENLPTPRKNKTKSGATAPAKPPVNTTESTQGIEYRTLYHKAVEEFVCSSEVGFRTLLKEFHDHQMVESRKDAMGTERLWVPFRMEELEGLIEDLAGEAF